MCRIWRFAQNSSSKNMCVSQFLTCSTRLSLQTSRGYRHSHRTFFAFRLSFPLSFSNNSRVCFLLFSQCRKFSHFLENWLNNRLSFPLESSLVCCGLELTVFGVQFLFPIWLMLLQALPKARQPRIAFVEKCAKISPNLPDLKRKLTVFLKNRGN